MIDSCAKRENGKTATKRQDEDIMSCAYK